MLTNVRLRAATQTDYQQISELLECCGLPTEDVSDIIDSFQIALADSRVIGCAAAERHCEAILIRSVAVELTFRDRGIASQLVDTLLIQARGTEVREAYLLSTAAPAYFARWGFSLFPADQVPMGIRTSAAFQRAALASALCMRRELT
ncbi:GNAT family N-acetyltransferase [Cupriavidus basilensis]|uniref:GNAT family N-acetyltransferase n=1 Tax=Cupriavidus basilensis TaxID=68895 RepID=A0ABT6AZ01_9BURK|nr:GNAT family N-acetyltransferase [Cupriavidus basilensis]MDF3837841.1 GNAT family N-acetyltransferase [Cupriavidus basilensis]